SGNDTVSNRMGPWGAYFADVAFLLFGVSAYLFPVLVVLAGVMLFRGKDPSAPRSSAWLKLGGVVLTIATSSGLATLHFSAPDLQHTAGGVLGQLVGIGLANAFGVLGSTVLLLVLWLGAVSLATGVSWLAVMDGIGRMVYAGLGLFSAGVGRVQIFLEGRRAKQQRQELITKTRAKPKPKIARRIEPTVGKVEKSARVDRKSGVQGNSGEHE